MVGLKFIIHLKYQYIQCNISYTVLLKLTTSADLPEGSARSEKKHVQCKRLSASKRVGGLKCIVQQVRGRKRHIIYTHFSFLLETFVYTYTLFSLSRICYRPDPRPYRNLSFNLNLILPLTLKPILNFALNPTLT